MNDTNTYTTVYYVLYCIIIALGYTSPLFFSSGVLFDIFFWLYACTASIGVWKRLKHMYCMYTALHCNS